MSDDYHGSDQVRRMLRDVRGIALLRHFLSLLGAQRATPMNEAHSVEALVEKIDRDVTEETVDFELWVPTTLTLRGAGITADVGMAVILDRLLAKGLTPDGFTEGKDGRLYRYKRP